MTSPVQRIAIYDLDRTITRLPTWSRFLLFAARHRAWPRLLLVPLLIVPATLKLVGILDRKALKEAMHRVLIGKAIAPADLKALAETFAAREVATNIRPGARASIAADIAAGHRVAIATAANRFYAAAIASRLGVDDLIATENAVDADGRILSVIAGDNCYGGAKACAIARRIATVASGRDDVRIRFYSDHISDLPAFEAVDEPVAVNPAVALRRIAETRGWRIVAWS